jgi:pre-mRNA-splicing factor SYF2
MPTMTVEDKAKERLMNTTGLEMDATRAKKERSERRAGFEWDLYNSESKYKSYKKRVDRVGKMTRGVAADGVDEDGDAMEYGHAAEPSEARVNILVADLKKAKVDRKNFKRHRGDYDDEDVGHINDANKSFNRQIDRAYGKYTTQIKNSLEKGTA